MMADSAKRLRLGIYREWKERIEQYDAEYKGNADDILEEIRAEIDQDIADMELPTPKPRRHRAVRCDYGTRRKQSAE